ncbi:SGNH/GDSL hydrolase family protein [Kineococcus rubinsiae]|uniref:SGNH/GDSL hydrolase family protein n=1 Tax=Kineococcus rubinsiae TaxID=2609562 RepID=UPI0027E4E31F|nr:SGNH/GDSL hydrolase family protein [Kineococcus rubinsiae]
MSPYRYVALGDSLTEGMVDATPDGGYRGWADRLAEHLDAPLRAAGEAPLEYANLAVRGRLLPEIVAQQVPQAVALRPDLVSLVGGGNDLLRPGNDPDSMAALFAEAVATLTATGAHVLIGTGFDTRTATLLRRNRNAVAIYNNHLWGIARRYGCSVLDLWNLEALHDRRSWGEDRIHLSSAAHATVALAALEALGRERPEGAPDHRDPLPAALARARREVWQDDLRWGRVHVLPWVGRRLRRTSSGAHRTGKRPDPLPLGDQPVGDQPVGD